MHRRSAFIYVCCFTVLSLARPQTSEESQSSEEEAPRTRRHGGFPHGGPGGPLPFAMNASEEAKTELKKILNNDSLTRQQLDEKVEAWATQQGEQISNAYKDFKAKMESTAAAVKQKIEESSLPATVKEAANRMADVFEDSSLTMAAAKQKGKEIMDTLSENDRKEVQKLLGHHGLRRMRRHITAADSQALLASEGPQHWDDDNAPMPKFLELSSEEGRKAFREIEEDKSLTKQEMLDKINEWASQQGQEVQEALNADYELMRKMSGEMKTKIEESQLSEEAKKALKEIEAIDSDTNITWDEDIKQRNEVFEKLPENVLDEISEFMEENLPQELAP